MLTKTFQHIAGFSEKKEHDLWNDNVLDWDCYLKKFGHRKAACDHKDNPVAESVKHLAQNDLTYFSSSMPRPLLYRLVNTFPKDTIFLDIETTGLSHYYNEITLVGWSKAGEYDFYINGQEEKLDKLREDVRTSAAIVTFNGSTFDLPFIRGKIQNVQIPAAHLDLRYFAKRLGYAGGQKIIEKLLKIPRPDDIVEVNGFEAVNLWYQYKEGNVESLRKLIKYNAFDIWGMKAMFEILCEKIIENERLPFSRNEVYPFAESMPDMNGIFTGLELIKQF